MDQVSWTPLAVRPDHRKRKTSDGPLQLAPPARGGGDGSQGGYLPAAVAEEADDDLFESSAPLSSGPAPGSASLKRRSSFSLEINPDEPETPPLRRGSSFGSTGDSVSSAGGGAASAFEGTLQQAVPPPMLPIRIGGGFQDLSPSSPVSGASSRRGAGAAGAEPGAFVCSRGARIMAGLTALLLGAALLLRFAMPMGGEPKLPPEHPGAAPPGAEPAVTPPPSQAQAQDAEPAAAAGAAAAAAAAPITLLLVAVLLGGACALLVAAVRAYRKWRDSERVMMVCADDDLNKLVERARAEWRAGRFAQTGQDGPGLPTHLEPNAAQRAWAAERIASLERA